MFFLQGIVFIIANLWAVPPVPIPIRILNIFSPLPSSIGTDCERLVNRRHIFDYYVSHSDVASTVRFLASKIPTLENPTLCPPFIISLCSAMPHATPYLHNTLLDELAR